MRPVFVHNSKQYPIESMHFDGDKINCIYYKSDAGYEEMYEENVYSSQKNQIKDLASHIKWIGRYDDLQNELVKLSEKKIKAYDEAAHEIAQSINKQKLVSYNDVSAEENYCVLSGQVAMIDELVTVVSALTDSEEKSATEMAVPVTQ